MITAQQSKLTINASAEHHTRAAECCMKATADHANAAKWCINGDNIKASEHAKKANDYCMKAQIATSKPALLKFEEPNLVF